MQSALSFWVSCQLRFRVGKVRKDFGEFLAQSLGFSCEAAEAWRMKWLNPRLTQRVAGVRTEPGLCPWPGTTPQLLWHDPRGKTTGKLRLQVQSVLCIHKSPICRFNQPQKFPNTEGGVYWAILCKRLEHSQILVSKAGFWNQCPWIPREDCRDSAY